MSARTSSTPASASLGDALPFPHCVLPVRAASRVLGTTTLSLVLYVILGYLEPLIT